jgi:ATP-dependent helicase Lhr and Lhr-like helicase
MTLAAFHPALAAWFREELGTPTPAQERAWDSIRRRRHTLVAAPTGSGKTLAAFLAALDELVREALASPDGLPDECRVVYVSPLKALSNDIHRNLDLPLAGIEARLAAAGLPAPGIRKAVRTGDTPAAERARAVRRPPHLFVTTPESLYILLGSGGGQRLLATARTVIVDEVHAVAGNKRGSHLALSLERLAGLVAAEGRELVRVGLSATVSPVDEVARFLAGTGADGHPAPCEVIDAGHRRDLDLGLEVPPSPLEAVMSNEVWSEVYDRVAELVRAHRTTIVFVNTRRIAERAARHLAERLGEERVAAHHGSLAKEHRLDAERRLKEGELSALVATASLELGIDVGDVDLVCQLGSTRSIAALLQRVGRAGHQLGGVSKGRLFPLSRDELVESAALLDAVRRGELDRLVVPPAPLDVLAQQIVAAVAAGGAGDRDDEGVAEDALYARFVRAWPYRDLPRADYDAVVAMLSDGFATRRGRRSAWLHRDAVHGRLRARRGARLVALTSGGAIPDTADFPVVLEPAGTVIGSVNEDFAVESMAGDVFQLGNASWRVLRIEQGRVRVEDAAGEPPSIPFWFGEAPGRTDELSAAVSRLRAEVAERLRDAASPREGREAAVAWLADDVGVDPAAGRQLVDYLAAAHAALGMLPTQETLLLERFFDEAGDMHLVLHAPFGSRVNRAWGLALRKRFCRTFNFELQAAATEDSILLSLGPTHSFPLDDVYRFLSRATARDLLVQALLDSPMFGVRWRWTASRALALPRSRGGKRVPPALQRHQAEDLVAVVFPDQLACLETIQGDREVPDHPLVRETLADCLTEAMDVDRLEALLADLEAGRVEGVARDLTEPSPLALEVLSARPYAFLDDAPLEERRSQAVAARRWLDPDTAGDLGALDQAAIDRVREEAWPEAADAEELHDALVTSGWIGDGEGADAGWQRLFDELAAAGRATVLTTVAGPRLWLAAERLAEAQAAWPGAALAPAIAPPVRLAAAAAEPAIDPDAARAALLRSRMDVEGPAAAADLAARAGWSRGEVESALAALEAEGTVLRGRFTPGAAGGGAAARGGEEWCERRLLARIHRATLTRLRAEIRPVGRADFARFLLGWQQVEPAERGEGPEALAAVLAQLAGFAAPAAAWEGEILPARVAGYDPAWLDALCLSGRFVWCRAQAPAAAAPATNGNGNGSGRRSSPIRTTPIAILPRGELAIWRAFGTNGAGAVVESNGSTRGTAASSAAKGRGAATGALRAAGADGNGGGGTGGSLPGGAAARSLGVATAPGAASPPAEVAHDVAGLSSAACQVHDVLAARGASFFADLAAGAGLLHTQAEAALAELAAAGLVTSDSFTGLRALLVPADRRPNPSSAPATRRRGRIAPYGMDSAGRWWLLDAAAPPPAAAEPPPLGWTQPPAAVEKVARTLLARYGVLFRALVARESLLPPWREILWSLRRLEARGEVRGGRFVDGFAGEQFALPEAVAGLRAARRARRAGGEGAAGNGHATTDGDAAPHLVSVSGADPLNLTGLLTPGERLPSLTGNRLLYRDGVPLAVRESKRVRFLAAEPAADLRWQAEKALVRTPLPPALRPYLGLTA